MGKQGISGSGRYFAIFASDMTSPSRKEQRKERRRLFFRKLKLKYRLVIIDENTFAEKFSLRLSPINLFIWVGSLSLLLILGTTMLIAYTPLREFIPGYPDGSERRAMIENKVRADSLEAQLGKYDSYVKNIQTILNGGQPNDSLQADNVSINADNVEFRRTAEDSLLRKKVEDAERYELQFGSEERGMAGDKMYGVFFFTPLQGTITQSFNPSQQHYGIDIAAPARDGIKATLDGTVIFSGWTSEGGHEVHLQHANNLVSIYKHNAVLLKKTGETVKAGDVIAIVGNSGELSDGPHLHFELWHKGKAIDPQNYLIF